MAKKTKKPKKAKKSQKKVKKAKLIKHQIKLRLAVKKDFLEIDRIEKVNGKNKNFWKPKFNVPYWLYNSKGKIENKNYLFDENSNIKDLTDYLVREQILVLKGKFD